METTYFFVGEGLGVPGLPHRITKSEALALGVAELLDGAIANGNYAAEGQAKADPKPSGAINLSDGVDDTEARLAGQTLAQRRGGKKEN